MSDPVRTVNIRYDRGALSIIGSAYLGTTADNAVDRIQLSNTPAGATATLVYGISIRSDGRLVVPEQELGDDESVLVNADVMRACTSGALPVRLRLDWTETGADGNPVTRRVMTEPVTLEVRPASPGSDTSRPETLTAAMTRISSWAWVETLTYKAGSIVAHGGRAWTSLQASNRGHEPVLGSEWWATFDADEETLAGLRDAISAEASAREAGDGAVKDAVYTSLSTEAADRQSADGKLREDLDAEISARTAAVSDEASLRDAGDAALSARITAEQAERSAADTAEATTRASADDALRASIGDNASAISAEASARESAVSAEATARAKAISDEASARQEADESEAQARQDADSALRASIDALGTAAHKNTGTSAGQVPILGAGGKLPNSVIPDLAISAYLGEAEDYAHLTALRGQQGDYAVVKGTSATSGTYILSTGTGSEASDWVRLSGPGDLSGGPGITVSGAVVSLSASGVTPGTRGSAVQVPVITADQYGRVTALGGAVIYPPTTPGTAGQVWRSDGSGAGVWETPDAAPTANSAHLVLSKGVKAAIDAEAEARTQADTALQGTVDGKAAKTEALGTGTALALGGGTGARTLTLTRKTVSGASSSSAINIPAATYSASGLMTVAQALRLDAALPASTPQVYAATIPQTDYLDVCLAQYVRIGFDKGLLSLSGHMRDISLPGDVWKLISIDTVMSAMGLTHKRPSAYRMTGWWHYDDVDDHGDRYGSGTVCYVSPEGGLELGRFYSGTDVGSWEMSLIGRDRYISVRDVYVEIK